MTRFYNNPGTKETGPRDITVEGSMFIPKTGFYVVLGIPALNTTLIESER